MSEPYRCGPIPRTMAEVEAENVLLRQLLTNLWRTIQSNGAAAIQYGQDQERTALMVARELERLGVPVDASVLDVATAASPR